MQQWTALPPGNLLQTAQHSNQSIITFVERIYKSPETNNFHKMYFLKMLDSVELSVAHTTGVSQSSGSFYCTWYMQYAKCGKLRISVM